MINTPKLQYHGDRKKAESLKGIALQFYTFCCIGIGESACLNRTKKLNDGSVIQAIINRDPYGNLNGVVRIHIAPSGGVKYLVAITYADRLATYSLSDYLKHRKLNRIERQKPFEQVDVTYYAGGCLMQSISEVSSPNKNCIGGYWINKDYSDSVSWIRDVIYWKGKYYQLQWITDDAGYYGVLACSVRSGKIFVITAKVYDGYDKTRYLYSSTGMDEVDLWVYQIGDSATDELNLTEIEHYNLVTTGRTNEDEIMAGFFTNPLNFYLYTRYNGMKTLDSYVLDGATLAVSSTTELYTVSTYDLDTGIDNVFRNIVSVATTGNCELKKLVNNALEAVTTSIPDVGNIYMFMFADVTRDVFVYAKATSSDGFYKLYYKGTVYDIDSLAITDTEAFTGPNVGNDQFTYAYNGNFIVFCFKLFTMIVDCTATTLSYKKYNYRFDAFRDGSTGTENHYTPLSVYQVK